MNTSVKIKRLKDISRIVRQLKKEGKRVVQSHGVFDLIHPGHIQHFTSAKKYGDVLIVTINADKYVRKGPGRPIFNQSLRTLALSSLEIVDYVIVIDDESALSAIKIIKPNVYVKGPDYKNLKKGSKASELLKAEEETVGKVGGVLAFTDDSVVFSSTALINDYLQSYPPKTKEFLTRLKNKYTSESIISILEKVRNLKVLVIGDAIIDEYHYCEPMGKSSKEPIIVHEYLSQESFAGGILATANHMRSLCNNVSLITLLGRQRSLEPFIRKHLKSGIKSRFYYRTDINTIVKRRYIDIHTRQKLFQVSFLNDDFIPPKLELQVLSALKNEIDKYDLVVVNDFGHGFLTEKIIRFLCKKSKYLALNVQANSANYGFNVVTKYPHAHYVCIDNQELRLATHDKYGNIKDLMKKICKKLKAEYIMVTRGPYGSIGYSQEKGYYESPALTQNIVDRVGAGDAFFALTSLCACKNFDPELVSLVGNVAAALKIMTVGNKTPITYDDLYGFITRLFK